MSLTVEQETDELALAETALVSEGNGVSDDAAKEAGVEAVNSQTEAIDARELKPFSKLSCSCRPNRCRSLG